MIYWIQTKKVGLGVLGIFLLCLLSFHYLFSPIDLMEIKNQTMAKFLSFVTNSAGSKGFVFTTSIFAALMMLCSQSLKAFRHWLIYFILLLIISSALKIGIKHICTVPRPFTAWLEQHHIISAEKFYQESLPQRITEINKATLQISPLRYKHWQQEPNSSFPSGHTLFALLCLLSFGVFFYQHKHYYLFFMVFSWSLIIAYSRIWLGMHSYFDLFGSWLIMFIIYLILPSPKTMKNH